MLTVHPITSFDLPGLKPYQTMKWQFAHRQQGIFVAEGEKVVQRLLESQFFVLSIMLPQHWLDQLRPILEARPEPIQAYVGEKDLLETLTGFSMYQGVLAVAKIPQKVPLPTFLARTPSPRFLLAADGLSNAENMGVLVRNGAAFGVDAFLVGETCVSPYLRRAVRSSMGTIFKMPVFESEGLAQSLNLLRAQGVRVVAAHPHTDERWLAQANFTGDCCVVLGSEGDGISAPVLAACDDAVAIPMSNDVDSLNVGSASAVFLYEAIRQRTTSLQFMQPPIRSVMQ